MLVDDQQDQQPADPALQAEGGHQNPGSNAAPTDSSNKCVQLQGKLLVLVLQLMHGITHIVLHTYQVCMYVHLVQTCVCLCVCACVCLCLILFVCKVYSGMASGLSAHLSPTVHIAAVHLLLFELSCTTSAAQLVCMLPAGGFCILPQQIRSYVHRRAQSTGAHSTCCLTAAGIQDAVHSFEKRHGTL